MALNHKSNQRSRITASLSLSLSPLAVCRHKIELFSYNANNIYVSPFYLRVVEYLNVESKKKKQSIFHSYKQSRIQKSYMKKRYMKTMYLYLPKLTFHRLTGSLGKTLLPNRFWIASMHVYVYTHIDTSNNKKWE